MITLYSGNPRSGKSLHMANTAVWWLKKGKNVISNFEINMDIFLKTIITLHFKRPFIRSNKVMEKGIGKYLFLDNESMDIESLIKFARDNHIRGKEDQTLICIDESQIKFNCREYHMKDRSGWVNFFLQHGKLGYYIILVASNDRLLDRQIRSLVEYEIKHRVVNNYKVGKFLPMKTFVAVQYWYGVKEKVGIDFFVYKKSYSKIYDSYKIFDFAFGKDKK